MIQTLTPADIADDLRARLDARNELLTLVRQILIDELRVDRPAETIDPDTPLFGSGLGLDSVDAVELVVALERAVGVDIARDRAQSGVLRTLNTVVDRILELRHAS
jgi:acyl carrier protein